MATKKKETIETMIMKTIVEKIDITQYQSVIENAIATYFKSKNFQLTLEDLLNESECIGEVISTIVSKKIEKAFQGMEITFKKGK